MIAEYLKRWTTNFKMVLHSRDFFSFFLSFPCRTKTVGTYTEIGPGLTVHCVTTAEASCGSEEYQRSVRCRNSCICGRPGAVTAVAESDLEEVGAKSKSTALHYAITILRPQHVSQTIASNHLSVRRTRASRKSLFSHSHRIHRHILLIYFSLTVNFINISLHASQHHCHLHRLHHHN